MEDIPRSKSQVDTNEDTIKALTDGNWQKTTPEIAERLNLCPEVCDMQLKIH